MYPGIEVTRQRFTFLTWDHYHSPSKFGKGCGDSEMKC